MVENQNTELAKLQVDCAPSLKEGLKARMIKAGFHSLSDVVRTLARDFNAGRIKYKGGILIS